MKPNEAIASACEKYIQTVIRAKKLSRSTDDFWRNKRAAQAHKRMFNAIGAHAPADLRWGKAVWEIAGSTAERILEEDFDENAEPKLFCETILGCLDALKSIDWIACLSLERVFGTFPEFTDFGDSFLVNPNDGRCELKSLLKNFRDILTAKLNVNFIPQQNPNNNSYLRLDDHYYNKSSGYIPGRPQMVMRVGRGDEFINRQLLSVMAASQLSLISICQIEYEFERGLVFNPVDNRLPTGQRMQAGMIEILSVAVAINVNTGEADWWPTNCQMYDTHNGNSYDADRFKGIWKDVAIPIIELRKSGLMESDKVRIAIDNAVRLVAKCRHRVMGDLTLNSVIATETILNPFGAMINNEALAIFAAALTSHYPEQRSETYKTVKELYNLRNFAVHQSRFDNQKPSMESGKKAFKLFLACLKEVVKWASGSLAEKKPCRQSEFKEFYARTVLSVGKINT